MTETNARQDMTPDCQQRMLDEVRARILDDMLAFRADSGRDHVFTPETQAESDAMNDALLAGAAALRAGAEALRAGQWQPIETAIQDEGIVWGCDSGEVFLMRSVPEWTDPWAKVPGLYPRQPSHWMPCHIPSPPAPRRTSR